MIVNRNRNIDRALPGSERVGNVGEPAIVVARACRSRRGVIIALILYRTDIDGLRATTVRPRDCEGERSGILIHRIRGRHYDPGLYWSAEKRMRKARRIVVVVSYDLASVVDALHENASRRR